MNTRSPMLQQTFSELLATFTDDLRLVNELWEEIVQHYSDKKRHYHTLKHLDHLLAQLTEVKSEIINWQATLFTLYYHDIIYNAQKSDNEEKSAKLAGKRMKQIAVPTGMIEQCKNQILATKSHNSSADSDTNYFTDADLSILGQSSERYSQYSDNVRKEYSVYPDFLYYPGRKKVLKHFLAMDRIFKTAHFYTKFEQQARQNLQKELELL